MEKVFEAKYCSLHVRKTNRGAFGLYNDVLNYEINSITAGYYADGEDAYDMRFYFNTKDRDQFRIDKVKREAKEKIEEEEKVNGLSKQEAAAAKAQSLAQKKKDKKKNAKKNKQASKAQANENNNETKS